MLTLASWTRRRIDPTRFLSQIALFQQSQHCFSVSTRRLDELSTNISETAEMTETSPEPPLPQPYGPLTKWIRDLYALDILARIANILSWNTRTYTERISKMYSKKDEPLIQLFWGDFIRFAQSYKGFFEVSRQRERLRSRIPTDFKPTEENVLRALEAVIPESGSIKIECFARLFHQSNMTNLQDLCATSDTIAERFVLKKNLDNIVFIRRAADGAIFDGWNYLGGNKPVAFCLEAAAMLLPALPDFWVPYDACLAKVSDSALVKLRSFFRIADVLRGGIEQSFYGFSEKIFVRRTKALSQYRCLPKCEVAADFANYHVTPLRALKISFSLPANFAPLSDVCVFPSVLEWAQTTPYSLPEVVVMFPEAMRKTWDGKLRSTLRGEYPRLSPPSGKESETESEKQFDEKLHEDENLKKNLLALVEEPTNRVFVDARPFLDKQHTVIRKRASKEQMLQNHSTFSDEAILREVAENVDDMDMPVRVLIEKIIENLHESKRASFRRTLLIKHGMKLHKLIEKNPQFGLVAFEERVEGSNQYTYHISKKTAHSPEGNRYLDPDNIHAEILFQLRAYVANFRR